MRHLKGREPVSIFLKEGSVIINGVEYFQHKPGRKRTGFIHRGVCYDTYEELMIAREAFPGSRLFASASGALASANLPCVM